MVELLDQYGRPLQVSKPREIAGGGRPGMRALNNQAGLPYDAADVFSPEMVNWQPYLYSPDAELSFGHRDRIVARARDMERNDGWARGGVQRILDTVIGANFRPISKPDYRSLQFYTGNSSFDAKWADEFGHAVDACWRTWADDIEHHCDGMETLSISQLLYTGMRHLLIDGDALAVLLWNGDKVRNGVSRYATALQLLDPDRLSNPMLRFDQNTQRGGVEVNQYGAPQGYWIRRAHQGDWFSAAKAVTWDFFPRRTPWGRPIVVHAFEHDRAGQHHGGAGVLTSIMLRLRMLVRYDAAELQAAIINAIFAAYVKSPYDPAMVEEALGADQPKDETALGQYQDMRNDWWKERRRISLGEAQMTHLFPGEEVGQVTGARPVGAFEPFEASILRHIAAGIGTTYEQLSGDFSRTNFSSFRGAVNEAKKTFDRRAMNFDRSFVAPIRAAAVEEFFSVEDLPLPAGAPPFEEFRAAYSMCRWLRPGRGWTNPLDEARASAVAMQAGLSTLEDEVAEASGADWEEVVDQRAVEIQRFKDRGLELPEIYQGQASNPDGGGTAGGSGPGGPVAPKGGKIGSGG